MLVSHCARPTRAFQFPTLPLGGVAEAALYCAHRTSTFLSCAFCEQEGHLAAPPPLFDSPQGRLLRSAPVPGLLNKLGFLLYEH